MQEKRDRRRIEKKERREKKGGGFLSCREAKSPGPFCVCVRVQRKKKKKKIWPALPQTRKINPQVYKPPGSVFSSIRTRHDPCGLVVASRQQQQQPSAQVYTSPCVSAVVLIVLKSFHQSYRVSLFWVLMKCIDDTFLIFLPEIEHIYKSHKNHWKEEEKDGRNVLKVWYAGRRLCRLRRPRRPAPFSLRRLFSHVENLTRAQEKNVKRQERRSFSIFCVHLVCWTRVKKKYIRVQVSDKTPSFLPKEKKSWVLLDVVHVTRTKFR